jgi:outer membrane lipoprotein-sorting protein
MRKILSSILLIIGLYSSVFAQTDPKAKAILAEVSKKYRSYKTIKSNFTFTVVNKQAKVNESQKGTLFVNAAANKYKVSMTDKDLISDGKTQWTYLKDDKEVQVNDAASNDDAMNPAQVFTMYEKGFKYLYSGERKVGTKVYQMIDLSPVDTKKPYFKIRLSIDKAAKQIASVLIFDKNGSNYTYNITGFSGGAAVPESTFAFDAKKYPGVEVVDLR